MIDQELLSSFRRQPDNNWLCVKPVMLEGPIHGVALMPGVRVSPVDLFMGIDLYRELEAAEARLTH